MIYTFKGKFHNIMWSKSGVNNWDISKKEETVVFKRYWLHKKKSDCKNGVMGYHDIILWLKQTFSICKEEMHFLCPSIPSSDLRDSPTLINVVLAAVGLWYNTRAILQTSNCAYVTPPGPLLFSAGTCHRKQFSWRVKWDRGVSSLSFSCVGSAGLTGAKSNEKWIFTTEVSSCESEYIKATAFLT